RRPPAGLPPDTAAPAATRRNSRDWTAEDPGGRCLFGRDAEAHRTAHAGASEHAIAVRVLGEILLVVILGVIERRRVEDLGSDGVHTVLRQLLLVERLRGLGLLLLLGREGVDA